MQGMDWWAVGTYVAALLLLFLGGKLFRVPIKVLGRLLLNAVLGGIALIIVNLLGGFVGIVVGINPVTALCAGILGIPGVALLLVLQGVVTL